MSNKRAGATGQTAGDPDDSGAAPSRASQGGQTPLFNEIDGKVRAIVRDPEDSTFVFVTVETGTGELITARPPSIVVDHLRLEIDQQVHLEIPVNPIRLSRRASLVALSRFQRSGKLLTGHHTDSFDNLWEVTVEATDGPEQLTAFENEIEIALYAEPISADALHRAPVSQQRGELPPSPIAPRAALSVGLIESRIGPFLRMHLDIFSRRRWARGKQLTDVVYYADTITPGMLDIGYEVSGGPITLRLPPRQTRALYAGFGRVLPPFHVKPGSRGFMLITRSPDTAGYRLSIEVMAEWHRGRGNPRAQG